MRPIARVLFESAQLTPTLSDKAEAGRDRLARMRRRQQVQERAYIQRDRALGRTE